MTHYDLIIRGGYVIDGTGAPAFKADIGVVEDAIIKLGDLSGCPADLVIDAEGMYVSPGIIDIHNHSDLSIFKVPTADNYVLQGVTTIVVGNCGSSPAPVTEKNKDFIREFMWGLEASDFPVKWRSFSEYLSKLDSLKKSINVAALIGHGTVRSAVLGAEDVKASERELKEMALLIEDAMKSGAFGMSLGLIYVPSMFADFNELTYLSKAVAKYGGLLAVHMRDEGLGLIDSVIEVITIAKETGVKLEISHLKAVGKASWGKAATALRIIEEYASRGLDVSADAYPYEASSTFLSAILPKWVREGGTPALLSRLSDPEVVEKLRTDLIREGIMGSRRLEWSDIMISSSLSHRDIEGLRLNEVASRWGTDPLSAVVKILLDDRGLTEMVVFGMNEEEVTEVISHPLVAISSDGLVQLPGESKPHPRNYGAFPRVIARYVREKKVLSLPEAIRKMTSLPARKLGLWDRGIIRPGFKADLIVFDFNSIKDNATYLNPHSYPTGIKAVVINGVVVVEEGRHAGSLPGKLLRYRA